MKKITIKAPLTVSTINRGHKFTLANKSFSNGFYAMLSADMAHLLVSLFVRKNLRFTARTGVGTGIGNNGIREFIASRCGNGNLMIGCMHFSPNNVRKIAKWTGEFSRVSLDLYFPKTERTAAVELSQTGHRPATRFKRGCPSP
jgi:hypothetical protein